MSPGARTTGAAEGGPFRGSTLGKAMVFIRDEGSVFDAPVDRVWEYIFGGEGHDVSHTTTRGGRMKVLNKDPFVLQYRAERKYRTKWVRETMRISFFPPVATVQELLDGPMKGSRWTYVYTPMGRKTQIDVFGEFRSKTLPARTLKTVARKFLANEFAEDAPAVHALARSRS
jgi:hypothetical protein